MIEKHKHSTQSEDKLILPTAKLNPFQNEVTSNRMQMYMPKPGK